MKTFKDFIKEDQDTDSLYRSRINKTYNKIKTQLEKDIKRRNIDFSVIPVDGGFMAPAVGIGADNENKDLVIFFANKKSGDPKKTGHFGFFGTKNRPVVLLKVVSDENNDIYKLDKLFDKDIFSHEYTHYLDWLRYSPQKKLDFQLRPHQILPASKYVNSPVEFNAFYQMGIIKAEEELKQDPQLVNKNFKYFFYKIAKNFPSIFLDNLNNEYEKKFMKRLYSFYKEKQKNENV